MLNRTELDLPDIGFTCRRGGRGNVIRGYGDGDRLLGSELGADVLLWREHSGFGLWRLATVGFSFTLTAQTAYQKTLAVLNSTL